MPNRIIKENIRTSRKVNDISDASFRFWVYLITYVDDFGRGSADLDVLKGFVYPKQKSKTLKNIEDSLNELESVGLIQRYVVDGEPFLFFPSWDEHQTVRNKKSKFPSPDDAKKEIEINCNQLHANVPVIQSNPIQSESLSEYEYELPKPTSDDDCSRVVSLFNEMCPSLPRVSTITNKRQMAICNEQGVVMAFVGGWEALFREVEQSDFLTGRSGKWKGCSFDWIVKHENVVKIMEGVYRNKDAPAGQSSASYDLAEFERHAREDHITYEGKKG